MCNAPSTMQSFKQANRTVRNILEQFKLKCACEKTLTYGEIVKDHALSCTFIGKEFVCSCQKKLQNLTVARNHQKICD